MPSADTIMCRMVRPVPSDVLRTARAQDGLITHRQATGGGLPSSGIATMVAAERWQRLGGGVYGTFTGALTDRQRAWRAVLTAGEPAVLGHESALWAHGLVQDLPRPVHVVVPAERRRRSTAEVTIARSRVARRSSGRPPRSSLEDAICDVAGDWALDRLAGLVSAVVL